MADNKICVLAIDDNPDNLIIIQALVEEAFPGAIVLFAKNGPEGLVKAQRNDPDVILLDIVMPGMDGFDVCRRLKADKTMRDIPVVFVTALKEDRENRIRALECGAEAFLTKPIEETELMAQISAMRKIKQANTEKRNEKKRLAELVAEKTRELEEAHAKTLRLLEELRKENESRKKSESALFEAQSLAHIGSFEREGKDDIIKWTKECLKIYGVKDEKEINTIEKAFAAVHPDDRAAFFRKRRQAMEKNKKLEAQFRLLRPDGSVRHVEFRFFPVFDNNGQYLRGHGTVQDVTERVKSEEALRESEEKYRRIAENISDVVWVSDMDMNLTYISPSVYSMIGETPEQYMSRPLAERFTPSTIEDLGDLFDRELKRDNDPDVDKNRTIEYEAEHYRADGNLMWLSMHINFLRNRRGRPIGLLGVTRDISEIKRADEALKNSEERFRLLFDRAPLGYQSVNAECHLMDVNKPWLEMMGYAREEVIGKCFLEYLSSESRNIYKECFNALVEDGEIMTEFEVVRKGGQVLLVSCVGKAAYDQQGQFLQSHCMLQDITQQRKAQMELNRQRGRAQQYLDIAGILFMVLDKNGQVSMINQKGCEILGLPKEMIIGKMWADYFVPDEEKEKLYKIINGIKKGNIEEYSVFENAVKSANGEERLISWRNSVLKDENGHYEGILFSGMDITEHDAALKALHESERSKSVLLSHIPGMAYRCLYDREWTMKFLSAGCLALTGYPPEDLLDNRKIAFADVICPEYRESIWKSWERAVREKKSFQQEYEITMASGSRKWVWEMGQALYDENGEVEALEGIVIDVDESKRRYDQIQYMNDHDFLTGLFNRKYYEEEKDRLEQEDSWPVGVMIADINGVRLINDAFGHAQGDRLIRATAQIIKDCSRKKDIVARTEGDAFGILMPGADREAATAMAIKIRDACEKHNEKIRKKADTINLSIGFGIKTEKGGSLDAVEKEAEAHLFKRKMLERSSHHSTILSSVMATMYARSQETEEHAERIARLSVLIGQSMNLPQKNLDELNLLAMLHDIGKIGIDDRILNKPGPLNEEEWIEMKKHPEIGYRIVITAPELQSVAGYILTHHERWDGSGYPRGLKGTQIPLVARILALADAYDAMTKDRVYRKGFSKQEAIEEIKKNAGKQFDPDIAKLFLELAESEEVI